MSASMQAMLAVILGAVVATLGGFAATQIGISIERTRRARGAALLCGEILAAIGALLRLAEESVLEGTFLGPLPSRFLRAARREVDVYDRNRELLFSVDDADLRTRLHSFMIRLSIPLDRLIDDQSRYLDIVDVEEIPPNAAAQLKKEIDENFEFLIETRQLIPNLLKLLQPLARSSFDTYSRIDAKGIPSSQA